jgi:hypothetical protein
MSHSYPPHPPDATGPAMAREYAAARFDQDRDRELIAAAFLAGWDACTRVVEQVAAQPVYQAAVQGHEPESFPHTLDGMRAAMDAAVLMAERHGAEAACLSVAGGVERVIRVYDPETRAWRSVLGGEMPLA